MPYIERRRSHGHLVYALISVACPFIAFAMIDVYQSYEYAEFWPPHEGPMDDADVNAGALMAFVIVVQLFLAIALGSLVGLIFAGLSLKRRFRLISFGTAALLFNAVPLGFFIWKSVRGW